MKILLVNKFHYLKGGSEKYYFELAELLKEHGHEVAFFSMQDEKNIKTDCKEYFVEPIDLNNGSKLKALDVIYSKKNKKKMEEALDDFKPDIVHLNNFQRQLSASIIKPIKKRNIPIVYTAHDLQAICPAITMLDNDKNICEKCMGGKYLNCIKKKCNKGSRLKSIIGALEGYYYRYNKIYTKRIDFIITPSEFCKNKMVEDGIDKNKIKVLHNFVDIKQYNVKTKDDGYILYFGRLSKEKGIINLIKAFKEIQIGKLYIAGEGPEKNNIEIFINENKLQNEIKLLGYLNAEQIKEKIKNCKFVIVPSICYENCPYSVLETLAIGKPILGANIGGIPELVKDSDTGLTYKYDNIEDLKLKIIQLYDDEKMLKKYADNAKKNVIEKYNKDIYYINIMKIYKKILSK